MQYLNQDKTGFTIIETLVAISILLVAVVAPLSLASQSLSASIRAKEKLIATYLAIEGTEYVRNVRDTNVLSTSLSWLDRIFDCRAVDQCTVEPSQATAIQNCGGEACGPLWFSEEYGIYGYTETEGWKETPYTRSFYLNVDGNEAEVVVNVSYEALGVTKTITTREYLKNWQ